MTEREKLIELMGQVTLQCFANKHCDKCAGYGKGLFCKNYLIADHLLSNGVVCPPCKVGDTVYEVQLYRERIQAYKVVTIKYNGHFWYMVWMLKDGKGVYGNLDGFVDSQLGKTVFLTKEEALKALKERSEGK